jgi:Leucine-rich repeat (LRR) protein
MGATITSFTGLQNLTNIERFKADYNSLTSINLSGMSTLIEVDLSDNDLPDSSTNSLSSVNLSGCTSLESLYLDDNDFSAGLPNLSDCTSLELIDFDQCNLVGSVDISNLPALEQFDFNGNLGLTELIISSTQPLGSNGRELLADDCALTQTAVDNILVALASGSVSGGYIQLDNDNDEGTNATPGEAGRESLFILNSRGWSFDVTNGNHTMFTMAYEAVSGSVCASVNLGSYYIVSGSNLQVGNKLYQNSDAWNPAANGFYATGSVYYQVSGSGLIIATGSCP